MKKFTKNQLNVIKKWLDLRAYMNYCFDCYYNPSDSKSKQEYKKMLIREYKWKVEHGYIER